MLPLRSTFRFSFADVKIVNKLGLDKSRVQSTTISKVGKYSPHVKNSTMMALRYQ